ncbi:MULTISPECIES: inositol monophosphatase family protein [Streptosporangium]|uniref:Myo-inositol-1(Or 4)-monophosphatase n=1 Tax=Streptosporangium brasiliense TaxID=47480 RepID=A0ABT9QYB3_9ACTN|nr:inositol monophosphatase [Streptosporangium brasiliense]MDP9861959.1 myo-inositol-1(or 4)-monophosphatase [Streptosporangium brasiliense]
MVQGTDLEHARRVAVDAARAAGRLITAGVLGTVEISPKGDDGDVVTDLDLASEELLLRRVLAAFPDHAVIAEESGRQGRAGSEWTWLIDPLDGTNNIAIGLPLYAVGLALCRDGRPELGVVHEPVTGRTWSAVRGRGVLGPSGPLAAPPHRPAGGGPVLAWIQGYGVRRGDAVACALKAGLDRRARRVLRLWAPLLAWVMLARGDIDGIVGYQTGIVDLPGGLLIAQEAGVVVSAFDGTPFDCAPLAGGGRDFVAGRAGFQEDLLEAVRAVP